MVLWIFRRGWNLVCAVVALAGLISIAEVGLRIARISKAQQPREVVADRPKWMTPSSSTGWELPRSSRFFVPLESGDVSWATNSWGLRGPEPVVPKPPGVYRILCLGDEALLGTDLPDDAIFARQLQGLLQQRTSYGIEVITAALPSSCPVTQSIHYRLHLLSLQSDLVLLHASAADVDHDRILRRWTSRDARGMPLLCNHPEFRAAPKENLVTQCRSEFALVDLCFQKLTAATDASSANSTRPSAASASLELERIRETVLPATFLAALCEAANSRLVVWFGPTDVGPQRHREFVEAAGPLLIEKRIPAVDAAGALSAESFGSVSGWTTDGHRRLAEFMAAQLLQNLQGPWSNPYATPTAVPASYSAPMTGGMSEFRREAR